jgi:ferredoxin/flavodoxin
MFYEKVKSVYFSPTGNSKKIANAIAKGLQATIENVDLTSPKARLQKFDEFQNELTIISSPVYVGRVPHEAAFRIRRLVAKDTPAILVVTYGNRAYEDALLELSDIVSEVGFKPIAGCAFLGEHSMSSPEKPVAGGRPDKEDLDEAEHFGRSIKEKLGKIGNAKDISPVKMPGKNPYTLRANLAIFEKPLSPYVDEEKCTKCGNCVDVCPVGAISIRDVVANPSPRTLLTTRMVNVDPFTCIWCTACIRSCPVNAFVRRPRMQIVNDTLSRTCSDRKKNESYL